MKKYKVLFAGESWFYTTTESKGFDQFTFGGYQTELERVRSVMNAFADITHVPSHLVHESFPATQEELSAYDAVIISDVGANTFLLPPDTFLKSKVMPNLLKTVSEYVKNGGTLIMMGGYLTFQGFEGKGKYHGTVIEEILPVNILPHDDRVECPEGVVVVLGDAPHSLVADFPKEWPAVLGYNKLIAKDDAEVVVSHNGDPLLALRRVGKGSTVAWASDCAPHWLPDEFGEWEYNKILWNRVLDWAVNKQ